MHRRTIAVVDLASGRITDCASDRLTLDVPPDFDRGASEASVDAGSRAHYLSITGSKLTIKVHPRPLSWRARGEDCLLAPARGSADEIGYRLCEVDPAP